MEISTRVRSCLAEFDSLRDTGPTGDESSQYRLDNELSRFKIWAGNLAAHRESGRRSLEYRLRDSDNLRSKVLDLLSNVLEILKSTHVINTLEVLQSSDSDSDSLDFEYDDLATQSVDHLRDLHQAISLLYHFSVALRAPAGHSRIEHGISSYSKVFFPKDVEHVTYKFPEAKLFLAERLGKGISARRQYFNYRQIHDEKMNAGLDEPEEEGMPSTIASSYRPRKLEYTALEDDTVSISSMNSFAPTESETGRLRPPQLPEEGNHGEPFKCPICFSPQCVQGEHSWQKHVFEDVVPYLCTERDCAVPNKLYARRKDWQRHQSEAHYSVWLCPLGCDNTYHSSERLEGHLVKIHNFTTDTAVLRRISDGAARPSGQTQDLHCPLCQKLNATVSLWYRHVGKHMEQLALYALPSHLFGEDSGDEDEQRQQERAEGEYQQFLQHQRERKGIEGKEEREEAEPYRAEMRKKMEELSAKDVFPSSRGPVYPKIHRDRLAIATLMYYELPWEYDKSNPDYIIILREIDKWETDVLFEHTSRLRSGKLPSRTKGAKPGDEALGSGMRKHGEEERISRPWQVQDSENQLQFDEDTGREVRGVDAVPESQGNKNAGSGHQEAQASARPLGESALPNLKIAVPTPEQKHVDSDVDAGVDVVRSPHTGQKQSTDRGDFVCFWCDASFNTQGDLTHHLRSHGLYTDRNYPCTYCQKPFQDRGHLTRHLRIHHLVPVRYYCPDPNCEYHTRGFMRNITLEIHLKSEHHDLPRDESQKEDGDPQLTTREEEDRSHLPEPYV